MAAEQRATSVHRALADGRRARIVGELEAAPQGLDVEELARRLGVHPNTVRWHLAVLADAGVVRGRAAERSTPGRPRILYGLRPDAELGTRDEHRLLATVLVDAVSRLPGGPERAEEAGRAWGRRLVRAPRPGTTVSEDEALRAVAGALDRHGFAPELADGGLRLRRCPLRALAAAHPEVVCTLHRGLVAGALAALGTALEVEGPEAGPGAGPCVLRLAAPR